MESSFREQSKYEDEEIRSFTGIPEIDLMIFSYLTDEDLSKACQINRYAKELCQEQTLWHNKILNNLPEEYAKLKPDELTWKEWYHHWRLATQKHNEINKILNLSPLEQVIRRYTQLGGILPGSEAYQSLSILLPRAFENGNAKIVNYFMEAFLRLTNNYSNTNLHPTYLINYPDIISSALKYGYDSYANIFIDLYLEDLSLFEEGQTDMEEEIDEMSLFLRECAYEIAAILGEYGQEELFKMKLLLNAVQIYPDDDIEDSHLELKRGYLNGLIISGRNEEAKKLFLKVKPDDLGFIYPNLVSFIIGAKNLEFLEYVNSFIPSDVFEEEYKPIQDRTLLEHNLINIDQANKLYPVEIFNALLKQKNPLALEYYEKNKKYIVSPRDIYPSCQLNFKDNKFFQQVLLTNYKDIDYAHCPTDFLVDLYMMAKKSSMVLRSTVDGITALMIVNGCYDAVVKIVQDDYRHDKNSSHWETVLDLSTSTKYKDLYLYFFVSYCWKQTIEKEPIEIFRLKTTYIPFEMAMIIDELTFSFDHNTDYHVIEDYNFHDTLMIPFEKESPSDIL